MRTLRNLAVRVIELIFQLSDQFGVENMLNQISIPVNVTGSDMGVLHQVHLPEAMIPGKTAGLFGS